LAVAGLAASDYIPSTFKGDTLLSGAVAALVPGVLMLSAFYMAFRFLKFASLERNERVSLSQTRPTHPAILRGLSPQGNYPETNLWEVPKRRGPVASSATPKLSVQY
jgi:hypothetical protein